MEFVKMHKGEFFLELFGEKKFDSHQAIFFSTNGLGKNLQVSTNFLIRNWIGCIMFGGQHECFVCHCIEKKTLVVTKLFSPPSGVSEKCLVVTKHF
jgi:hypothetical protein